MSKSTVEAVLHTMPSSVRLMDTSACLVIAEMVLALGVTSGTVQIRAARGDKIFKRINSTSGSNVLVQYNEHTMQSQNYSL